MQRTVLPIAYVLALGAALALFLAPQCTAAIVQTFSSSGSFTVPTGVTSISVLVVGGGGGGGGGWLHGAGGGGGGVVYSSSYSVVPSQTFGVTVGQGGAGGVGQSRGATGGNSNFAGLTAYGGGGGGNYYGGAGLSGSSGGGGNYAVAAGSGTAGQGNSGGTATGSYSFMGPNYGAGGGGGAGSAGGVGMPESGGAGGTGVANSITGSSVYYGGGGGGSTAFYGTPGTGGAGGGGAGSTGNGMHGSANTGGGGGGGERSTGVNSTGGNGGSGVVIISYEAPPTCSTSVSPSTINQGQGSTLTWSSTNASQVYIDNVGWVNPSGSTTVAPSTPTNYRCYGSGPGGESDWMSTGTTLTVNQSCSFNEDTILHGSSVTAYQESTAPAGFVCVSEERQCNDGSLSGSYQYASCSCDPYTVYSCSPQDVVRTVMDTSCVVTVTNPYATCTSPSFCSAGSAVCLYAAPVYGPSGQLRASPSIVRQGGTTRLFWDVENVESCSVTGNGETFNTTASPVNGQVTDGITTQTEFTLTCTPYGDHTFDPAIVKVNIAPKFVEPGL